MKTGARGLTDWVAPVHALISFRDRANAQRLKVRIALLLVAVFGADQGRPTRIEERKNDLVNITTAAMSIVKEHASFAHKGELSNDNAQKQALELLRTFATA